MERLKAGSAEADTHTHGQGTDQAKWQLHLHSPCLFQVHRALPAAFRKKYIKTQGIPTSATCLGYHM